MRREGGDEADCFQADAADLANEADDVFGVVSAVGVGADAALLVFGHLVLVNDPFERAAVSEAVFEGFARDAGD